MIESAIKVFLADGLMMGGRCCIAVIQRSDDDDDKLIVVPHGREYSDEQILALTEFQERFFESSVTREAGS